MRVVAKTNLSDDVAVAPAAFQPSSEEKADPPVRVSVWNRARTTPSQARHFTKKPDPELSRICEVSVDAIRTCREECGEVAFALDVIEDPVPGLSGPGSDGHCGILGLDVQNVAAAKLIRKSLMAQLADKARVVDG